ncbi:hypothetical protein H6A60_06925 [Sutterella massiliensis]|uniref:Uncharacterized protein n=1 Tax=Sutterella massiliensis TaxID=1816689 RepID=A0ABS2DU17_9BURK|nr:hypothetical protein [Sutterella massiliensis]MBM6704215.1 hypothetical protein [Sutterella massiliensis]
MINGTRDENLDSREVLDRTEAFMADTLTIRRKKEVMPTMLTRLSIPEGRVKTVQDLERYIHDRTQVSEDEKSLSFEHGELTIRIFQSAGGGWRISSSTAAGRVQSRPCPIAGEFFSVFITPRIRNARRAAQSAVKSLSGVGAAAAATA